MKYSYILTTLIAPTTVLVAVAQHDIFQNYHKQEDGYDHFGYDHVIYKARSLLPAADPSEKEQDQPYVQNEKTPVNAPNKEAERFFYTKKQPETNNNETKQIPRVYQGGRRKFSSRFPSAPELGLVPGQPPKVQQRRSERDDYKHHSHVGQLTRTVEVPNAAFTKRAKVGTVVVTQSAPINNPIFAQLPATTVLPVQKNGKTTVYSLPMSTIYPQSIYNNNDTDPSYANVPAAGEEDNSDGETPRTQPSNPNAISQVQINEIVFSPYRDDKSCKDAAEMRQGAYEIMQMAVRGVRVYSTDCNMLKNFHPHLVDTGIMMNQGFWLDSDGFGPLDDQVNAVIDYSKEFGWDQFSMILVANEAVLSGYIDAPALVNKIRDVKQLLRNAGYNGPVSTAEPPVQYKAHPELCQNDAVDFVGINSHSYFAPEVPPEQSGAFVLADIQTISELCGADKRVYVTETGYPSGGNINGLNIPTKENQKIALKSIIDVTNGDITILTLEDEKWKAPGPYGIEQHFGVLDLL